MILGALGVSLGHIDDQVMGLITLVGLVTIGLSTYMILYSHPLYERLASWLRVFERSVPHREQAEDEARGPALNPDVIVFGLGRYGSLRGRRSARRGLLPCWEWILTPKWWHTAMPKGGLLITETPKIQSCLPHCL